ncbi:cell wall integrity and stress response component [Microdochium nivale]|nr:cell wall integrity and stress response component [Microdochium nivale]
MASNSGDSPDAQSWVFPARGVEVPPVAATNDFGIVHFGDSMILEWDAATTPDVVFTCFSQLGNQTNYYAVRGRKSPATYKFTETALQQGAFDLTFCHFYFDPSLFGNTVVFQYDNKPHAKPSTWSAGVTSSTATSSTASSASVSITASTTASTTTGLTSATVPSSVTAGPTSDAAAVGGATVANPGAGGLSAGASAGIGVGAALGVVAVVVVGFLLYRRRKKPTQAQPAAGQHGPYEAPTDAQEYHDGTTTAPSTYYSPYQSTPKATYYGSTHHQPTAPAELHGGHRPTELP